jgi:FtsP/CotA-like multicopper oxidase with cupredoxin domain
MGTAIPRRRQRWVLLAAAFPPPAQTSTPEKRRETAVARPSNCHGHRFTLIEVAGTYFVRPLPKDVSLVPANGGTATWQFLADAAPGRWLLHCHNEIHMLGGMMTEVVY